MDNKSRRLNPIRAAIAGLALAALPMSSFAFVSVGVSITVAPPALPVYVQPPCPAVGYIWTPGYWAYGDDDYYWVPGTWVMAPSPGLLWTPGYWGWGDGLYVWHAGYWGPHVGFYGGVNYGYGYGGVGFEGGYWRGGAFYYNRSVANLGGINVTNVYNKTVINNVNVTRVSYNGGEGGLRSRPSPHELAAEHDRHIEFTSMQRNQERAAFSNHDLRASVNQGRPRIAATQRPGAFTGHGVEAARAGEWRGGPAGGRAPESHVANDRGGAGRGPDTHGADRGGPGHGGPGNVASRNDRPAGASGSAEVRGGMGGSRAPNSFAAGRNDRPPGTGGQNRGPTTSAEPTAHFSGRNDRPTGNVGGQGPNSFAAGRNDRPPGAGSPEVRGSTGGGVRTEQPHGAVARTERPSQPYAGGNAMNRAPQPQHEMRSMAPPSRPAPQPSPQRFEGGGQPRPQMAPRQEAPQPSPQRFEGGGQPRPQMAPRQEAPHPQSAPRPDVRRGGGEPQGRGPNEHGRR